MGVVRGGVVSSASESEKGGGRRFVQCHGAREGKSESLREILMCITYKEKYRYTHHKIEPTHKVLEASFIGRKNYTKTSLVIFLLCKHYIYIWRRGKDITVRLKKKKKELHFESARTKRAKQKKE